MGWIIVNSVLLKGSDIQVLYFTGHHVLAGAEKSGGKKRKAIPHVATAGSNGEDASQCTQQDNLSSHGVGF